MSMRKYLDEIPYVDAAVLGAGKNLSVVARNHAIYLEVWTFVTFVSA